MSAAPTKAEDATSSGRQGSTTSQAKSNRTKYWVVKLPTWLASEWFDSEKYTKNSEIGRITSQTKANGEPDVKMSVVPPPMKVPTLLSAIPPNAASSTTSTASTGGYGKRKAKRVAFNPTEIPTELKMRQRAVKNRTNVKHGQLQSYGEDRLLIFMDKPPFQQNHTVESLNPNRENKFVSRYQKGTITHVNDDRTYTVEFEASHLRSNPQTRTNVPQRDIRLLEDDPKADSCKKLGKSAGEFDMVPDLRHPKYLKFLRERKMNMSTKRMATTKVQTRKSQKMTKTERERAADARIARTKQIEENNRRIQQKRGRASADGTTVVKKAKAVRKSDEQYRQLIFALFADKTQLSQQEIADKTQEKWSFMRPVMETICDQNGRRANEAGQAGKVWQLKPQYQLATDAPTSSSAADASTTSSTSTGPPPAKRQRLG